MRELCSYEDQDYKAFWTEDRAYEDQAERIALRKLLPKQGESILDLGAGFGRLTKLYLDSYQQVTLYDYAQNLLDEAKSTYGISSKIKYVQGDARHLPFEDSTFDTVICVRVFHHIIDADDVLKEIYRVLRPKGTAIVEFANKKHFKEVWRWLTRRSNNNPFDLEPLQRGDGIFYNFHPHFIRMLAARHDLVTHSSLSVSNFRLGVFKKIIPMGFLLKLESLLQKPLSTISFGPSIFLKLKKMY